MQPRALPVQLQLSYPEHSHFGPQIELRLIDVASRVVIATIPLTAEQFRDLLAGRVDERYPTAQVADVYDLAKVGLPKHNFSRAFGQIAHPDARAAAQAWIDQATRDLSLHAGTLEHHNHGYSARWSCWKNLDGEEIRRIQNAILTRELPEELRR